MLVILRCSNLRAESVNLVSRPPIYKTVLVPPGKFDLFIPVPTFFQLEYVKKEVRISKAFEIGKYEVSNAQWNACFKAGGCRHEARIEEGESRDNPVVRVSWHDAFQFSVWLSKVSGKKYRLPTEEEWSYAVQTGKSHRAVEIEYDYSQPNEIVKRTKPRGSYPENEWGVSDYLGNVWEWSLSCWYASEENILKEEKPEHLNSPEACFTRIALGENRSHVPDFISDTYSGGCATLRPAANLGFRLVREL